MTKDIGIASTPADLAAFVAHGKRGDRTCYHVGTLMRDRQRSAQVNAVGAAAWKAHIKGDVLLAQHRPPGLEGGAMYLAIHL